MMLLVVKAVIEVFLSTISRRSSALLWRRGNAKRYIYEESRNIPAYISSKEMLVWFGAHLARSLSGLDPLHPGTTSKST